MTDDTKKMSLATLFDPVLVNLWVVIGAGSLSTGHTVTLYTLGTVYNLNPVFMNSSVTLASNYSNGTLYLSVVSAFTGCFLGGTRTLGNST